MPELPDVELYVHCLRPRVVGRELRRLRILNPFVLRSVDPDPADLEGRRAVTVERLGKRIVIAFEGERFLVIHLMIAGRLRWSEPAAGPTARSRIVQAAAEFETGTLALTEAGTKRRASIHLVAGASALEAHDPGGLDVLAADRATFATRLTAESRTLKRALTDPRVFSGIGNPGGRVLADRSLSRLLGDDWTGAALEGDESDGGPDA